MAGAQVVDAAAFCVETVLKVCALSAATVPLLKSGTVAVDMLNPYYINNITFIVILGLTAFVLEAMSRTLRAQSMDVLSS